MYYSCGGQTYYNSTNEFFLFLFTVRRQIIYGKIKADIGEILIKLCDQKGVEIIEANACKDHIHTLVSIPAKTI